MPRPYKVLGRRQETTDTWTLELDTASAGGPSAAPGQFMMLSASGAGEVPISVSGDPDQPERLVHTVRAVGMATRALCAAQPGAVLSGRGPFGHAWPLETGEPVDVVLAAGGIGLAPLRPAILRLLSRRDQYRRLVLLYGARSPDQLLYAAELRAWSALGLEVHVTVDTAGPEWTGAVGVVTTLVGLAGVDGAQSLVLSCGPEVMMRFMVASLREAGVRPDRIYASLERNMQCGVARCGHCQLGPTLVCRDGPVYRWTEIEPWLMIREL